jgi:hypothetical protein
MSTPTAVGVKVWQLNFVHLWLQNLGQFLQPLYYRHL